MHRIRRLHLAALAALALMLSPAFSQAQPLNDYSVSLDLTGLTPTTQYGILFQLNANGTPLNNNMVNIDNFSIVGGTAGAITNSGGGAVGAMPGIIGLFDTTAGGNFILQQVSLGTQFVNFDALMTSNANTAGSDDVVNFAIFDYLANDFVPTSAPDGFSFATFELTGNGPIVTTFAGTGGPGNTGAIVVTAIPEPSSVALLGIGLAGVLGWTRRRRKLVLPMAA